VITTEKDKFVFFIIFYQYDWPKGK